VQAIHGLLDLYEKGMLDRDIDLMESILSDVYLDAEEKHEREKLEEWRGPFPPLPRMVHSGFLYESTKHFRLEDREIYLEDGKARILCRENSQWVNNFVVMRETRANRLEFLAQEEDGGVWRITSVNDIEEYGRIWSDEFWYPDPPYYPEGWASFWVTGNLYDDQGTPSTSPSLIQGQEWLMETCENCSYEEALEESRNCCLLYCLKHRFDCIYSFPDNIFLMLHCISRGCKGALVSVPDEPGLGELDIELKGKSGSVMAISHRFRIVDWGEDDWDRWLLVDRVSDENSIRSVCRGPDNAMWFGTRKDGRIYRHTDLKNPVRDLDGGIYENDMNQYSIQAMTTDTRGNLWFGVVGISYAVIDGRIQTKDKSGKVLRYDPDAESKWTEIEGNIFGRDKDPAILDLLADDKGGVWFAGEGIKYWDGEIEAFTTYYSDSDGIGAKDVNCLVFDDDGNLWCGTAFGGISRFDGSRWTTFTYSPDTPEIVGSLELHVAQLIESIKKAEPIKLVLDLILPPHLLGKVAKADMVWCAAKDGKGQLWFGTYGAGLLVFRGRDPSDRSNWDHFTVSNTSSGDSEGLISNIIMSIAVDPQDRVWIGTMDGLNCLDDRGTRDQRDDSWITYRAEMFYVMSIAKDDPFYLSTSSAAWDIAFNGDGEPLLATEMGVLHLRCP
jgi:streptogramin lyase